MNMVELLGALDLELPHDGKIHCIFHAEATPSLHVYEDHWYAYCCGKGGDAIGFVMGYFGCSYTKAVQWLASNMELDPEDVPLVVRQNVTVQQPTFNDLTDRFFNETKDFNELSSEGRHEAETFIKLRWGLHPRNLWSFGVRVGQFGLACPHYFGGRIVGVKLRSFSGAKTSISGSKFTGQLYRPWLMAQHCARAVLVEGESDAWVMRWLLDEHTAVYALPSGASTWRDEWARELVQHHQQIVVVLDNDDAGRSARDRIDRSLLTHRHIVQHGFLPDEFNDVCEAFKSGWDPRRLLP